MDEANYERVLSKTLSTQASARIIDFFLDHKEFDYPIVEVAKKTGLSLRTVIREIPKLEANTLIIEFRKVGRSSMYKLNTENKAVPFLEKFVDAMAELPSIYEPAPRQPIQEIITEGIQQTTKNIDNRSQKS